MSNLYVFIDESGNLDFKPTGTNHYVLAAVTALDPLSSSKELQQLKYDLLAENSGGNDFQNFHATEDTQKVRDRVFERLSELTSIKVNYIVAEKRKAHPDIHGIHFYSLLVSTMVKYFLTKYNKSEYEKIILICDQAISRNEQSVLYKEVRPVLKEIGKPYAIYFHRTMSDFNGQIADYFAWAKYVELERNEKRPIMAVSHIPMEVFDIFGEGSTYYY